LQKVSSTEKKDTIQEIRLTVNNLEDFSEPIEQLLSKTVVAQVIEKLKEYLFSCITFPAILIS